MFALFHAEGHSVFLHSQTSGIVYEEIIVDQLRHFNVDMTLVRSDYHKFSSGDYQKPDRPSLHAG